MATLTLDDYTGHIAVLVGHSMGGVVITGAAERVSDRLERLVYVCAFLPANGQALCAQRPFSAR